MVDDQPALDSRLERLMPTVHSLFVAHGVQFTDFHSETPLCCPARAGYLTGLHTFHHRVIQNDAGLFNPRMSLAVAMHRIGYHTLLVGKYLNRYGSCRPSNPADCAPRVPVGWDSFTAFSDGAYYRYALWSAGHVKHYGSTARDYSTDVIAQRSVAAIRAAPRNRPLFAWIAPYAPHSPITPAPRYRHDRRCHGPAMRWAPPDYNPAVLHRAPLYVQQTPRLQASAYDLTSTCRALLAVDDLVRRVRDALAATGRLHNTLLVYAGDNGMLVGSHRLERKTAPYATQVPFAISWPKVLGGRPRTIGERLENIDVAPTLCAVVGCQLGPYPHGIRRPDGISFLPLLLGRQTTLGREAVLEDAPVTNGTLRAPAWQAAITTGSSHLGHWEYVVYADGERELYRLGVLPCYQWQPRLRGDPCMLNNVAGEPQYASVERALNDRLAELSGPLEYATYGPPNHGIRHGLLIAGFAVGGIFAFALAALILRRTRIRRARSPEDG
jgi:arylsulfatase A-like enzyme